MSSDLGLQYSPCNKIPRPSQQSLWCLLGFDLTYHNGGSIVNNMVSSLWQRKLNPLTRLVQNPVMAPSLLKPVWQNPKPLQLNTPVEPPIVEPLSNVLSWKPLMIEPSHYAGSKRPQSLKPNTFMHLQNAETQQRRVTPKPYPEGSV